ncbi:unnamed protein product [Pipistrellus nathusii]|uniref:Uncharacterized protein n=1 Tax=Pipistrellus nathusii TaxID=59473 RepID=A0ABN9ZUA6_PIPNA
MSWKKKNTLSAASPEKVTVQCALPTVLTSRQPEPMWPSFGQTSKTFIKKRKTTQRHREDGGDVLNLTRVRAIRAFALKDGHVLVSVNKPLYHQTAMPVSSTANSVL